MSEFADRVEAICNEIAAELGIHLEGGGPYSSALNSVIRKAQGFGECQSDPNFQLDYWKVCRALSRAFDADENSNAGFWDVVVELQTAYPRFDWKNAMTDVSPAASAVKKPSTKVTVHVPNGETYLVRRDDTAPPEP